MTTLKNYQKTVKELVKLESNFSIDGYNSNEEEKKHNELISKRDNLYIELKSKGMTDKKIWA